MWSKFLRKRSFLVIAIVFPLLASFPGKNKYAKFKEEEKSFSNYRDTIRGTKVFFEMIAIPGGKFLMGSPQTEKEHHPEEGPVHDVQLDSFWIGKLEITWDEYELFVYPALEKEQEKISVEGNNNLRVDAVTRPTSPFTDMSFGMGKNGFPAVNMTQYAALSYCKWLTAKTGHFYRLPTEAEWEYACRAGSKTAYSFGNDITQLSEYAWFSKNSKGKYQKVGTRKPNKWGVYDMHGNVAEWTLDQYLPEFYSTFKGRGVANPWAEPTKLYPRVVRGGSWYDDPGKLRSSARLGSSPKWKQRDPQLPKSNWWNTDASFVGFRIVRPLKNPTTDQVAKYFAEPLKDY